jgi:predicted PurR-regulated permease PerM
MIEDIQNILRVVTFIAIGGLFAIAFFFVFAQIITGSKTIHKQLNHLTGLAEQILEELRRSNKQPK